MQHQCLYVCGWHHDGRIIRRKQRDKTSGETDLLVLEVKAWECAIYRDLQSSFMWKHLFYINACKNKKKSVLARLRLLSCADRPTEPQTSCFNQILAGLGCKWFLRQGAKQKVANAPGHTFALPSFLDLPPMAAQTKCKFICYLAEVATAPV